MSIIKTIKKNFTQISALTELNLKLNFRYKINLLLNFLTPFISVLIPLFIMSSFFEIRASIGQWTLSTYYIYALTAINLFLLKGIIEEFPRQMLNEKYWKTITALIIGPFNRFNLIFEIILTHLTFIFIPFIIFIILSYIIYPISFITFIFVLLLYILIALIFSGIGLIISVFAISKENIWSLMLYGINFVFWFSCITYPYQIFPVLIQRYIINLNPLYYTFDILRNAWIENDIIFTIRFHPLSFVVLVVLAVVSPCIGVFMFNKVYKKYGIVGY